MPRFRRAGTSAARGRTGLYEAPFAGLLVILQGPHNNLAGVNQVSFSGEEAADQFLDRDAFGVQARFSPGVEIDGLLLVKRKRVLPVIPRAEVVQFPPYLLCPSSRRMCEKRKDRIRLRGLVSRFFCGKLSHNTPRDNVHW